MMLDDWIRADGFLVLDKPQGVTSQRAVAILKRLFRWRKVGHTGTLDPLATGVLPIAYGEATKAIPFLDENLKVYTVQGKLGESSDTYDAEGERSESRDYRGVTESKLETALQSFLGEISQTPPPFSAVKIQGRPAYQLARKGVAPELKARTVRFDAIELSKFDPPYFDLKVSCSRGTYIRSLIHDLGEVLGCGAFVTQLRRLQTGPFTIEQAVTLDQVQENLELGSRAYFSIEESLKEIAKLPLLAEELKLIRCGNVPHRIANQLKAMSFSGTHLALTEDGRIVALLSLHPALGWKLERVLNRILG